MLFECIALVNYSKFYLARMSSFNTIFKILFKTCLRISIAPYLLYLGHYVHPLWVEIVRSKKPEVLRGLLDYVIETTPVHPHSIVLPATPSFPEEIEVLFSEVEHRPSFLYLFFWRSARHQPEILARIIHFVRAHPDFQSVLVRWFNAYAFDITSSLILSVQREQLVRRSDYVVFHERLDNIDCNNMDSIKANEKLLSHHVILSHCLTNADAKLLALSKAKKRGVEEFYAATKLNVKDGWMDMLDDTGKFQIHLPHVQVYSIVREAARAGHWNAIEGFLQALCNWNEQSPPIMDVHSAQDTKDMGQ